ncbi:MAG: hypothetical protein PVG89_08485 [Gammaproteobacteria bacterium]|jgi:hypothetical protein
MKNKYTMYSVFSQSPVLLIVVALLLAPQASYASLAVGVEMQSANWEVSPPANQPNNDTTGIGLGFNVKIKFYKLYTGLDYLRGLYDFDSQNVPGIATANPDTNVTRTEWNAVVGYDVFRYLSLFAKYKSLDFDNGANYRLENPGVGVQVHYPLSSHWLIFANTAQFTGDFSMSGGIRGDTDIAEQEMGIAYRPSLHTYIEIGMKRQEVDYDYDSNGKESHQLQGFSIGYHYVF